MGFEMSNVTRVDFGTYKKRYIMGCPECDATDWTIVMDPDAGADIEADPDANVDMECVGISCSDCGYYVDMQGTPVN